MVIGPGVIPPGRRRTRMDDRLCQMSAGVQNEKFDYARFQRTFANAIRSEVIYSMISSASAERFGGTSMPSALAVLRLMTSSNLVDCTTGKSPGFSPLRILPA